MSDFLRNLRSSHKKESSNSRRNLDGHYYPQKNRRQLPDRRSNHSEALETLYSNLNDILPQLLENTTLLTEDLKEQNKNESKLLIEAKIRQCNAISTFFETLNCFLISDLQGNETGIKPKATASYASGTHYTKDEIFNIIHSMRKNGATYATIAEYLKNKGIPTFSGRGEWHAQTIHRLCK